MQIRLQFLFILLTPWLLSAQMTAQEPVLAEIITPDTEFCENGELTIEIKFGETYEAPFDAWISIRHADGNTLEEWLISQYHPSSNNGNYILLKTFDASVWKQYGEFRIAIDSARYNNADFSTENLGGPTTVHLYQTPTPQIAGEDTPTCGLSKQLNATPGTESNSYFWEPVTGASFDDANLTNPVFTADQAGTFELTFTQTNGACSASGKVSTTLWGQPSATLSTESEICGTGDAEIDFNLLGNGPWSVHYSFGTEAGQFSTSNSSPIQTHTLTEETSFQLLSVTDANGCSSTYSEEPGTKTTVIDLLPSANAGNDRAICDNEITLSAAEPAIGTGTWSGGGHFSNINAINSLFQPDPFTGEVTKTLTWTVKNKDCTTSDQVAVTFYEQLEADDISAGKDTLLYQQKTYILKATPPPFGEGTWTIAAGNGVIAQVNNPKAEIGQLDFGQTLLRWTVTNGECMAVWKDIEISVQGIENPTGFSPNSDGKNDQFKIPGAEHIRNNQLIVFNQQGTVVYKKTNYQNNWDGTKENGEDLPDGYYYYAFTGEGVNIKDYLIIKRSMR